MSSLMSLSQSMEDLLAAETFLTTEAANSNSQNGGFDEFLSSDEFLKAIDRAIEQTPAANSNGKKRRSTKKRPSKIKRSRDLPKRPVSSYNRFFQQERPKVTKEFPNVSFGNIARIIGQRWSRLDATSKAKLDNLYQQDLLRYRREVANMSNESQATKEWASQKRQEDTSSPVQPPPHPIPPSPTLYRSPVASDTVVIHPNWAQGTLPFPHATVSPITTRYPEDHCVYLKPNSIVKWENQTYRVDFRPYRMKEAQAKRFLATYCNDKNQVSIGQIPSIGQPPGQPLQDK